MMGDLCTAGGSAQAVACIAMCAAKLMLVALAGAIAVRLRRSVRARPAIAPGC